MIRLKGLLLEDYAPDINFSAAKQFISAMKSRGFSENEAIALAANVAQETGGTYNPAIKQTEGGPGRGLFQWEMPNKSNPGRRFKALEAYAKHKGTSWSDRNTQYDFIRNELLNNYNDSGFDIKDHLPDFDNEYYTRLYSKHIKPLTDVNSLTSKIAGIVFACGGCKEGGSSNTQRKVNAKKIKEYLGGASDVKPIIKVLSIQSGTGYIKIPVEINVPVKDKIEVKIHKRTDNGISHSPDRIDIWTSSNYERLPSSEERTLYLKINYKPTNKMQLTTGKYQMFIYIDEKYIDYKTLVIN